MNGKLRFHWAGSVKSNPHFYISYFAARHAKTIARAARQAQFAGRKGLNRELAMLCGLI